MRSLQRGERALSDGTVWRTIERAVATLEEKEHQQQEARAKQEQDNLRRLQQLCRQVETLAAGDLEVCLFSVRTTASRESLEMRVEVDRTTVAAGSGE